MSFTIIGTYRLPSAVFYDKLNIKDCGNNNETILFGDFNLHWNNKVK